MTVGVRAAVLLATLGLASGAACVDRSETDDRPSLPPMEGGAESDDSSAPAACHFNYPDGGHWFRCAPPVCNHPDRCNHCYCTPERSLEARCTLTACTQAELRDE